MKRTRIGFLAAGWAAMALLAAAQGQQAPQSAQAANDAFYRAYYLAHERGDLEGALALFREVAAGRGDPALKAKASAEIQALTEDLAASDFSRLMPPGTILYAELNRPGAKLEALLDQLGLLGKAEQAGQQAFAISPQLVQGLLGLRGAAVAITAINPAGGPPEGVLVVHPGDLDVVRGLIETAIPAGAAPAEPIGGHPTWKLQGDQAFATLTSRLLVLSPSRTQIEGVLARLSGREKDSLAASPALRKALERREDALLSFFVNAEPVRPMLRAALEQEAQRDPGARMALTLFDVDSLESLGGQLSVGAEGLQLDVALRLAEGHQNVVFNLMRRPAVGKRTLELVPEGAAFFLVQALNEPAPTMPKTESRGGAAPIVTALDFGREVFANVVDFAIYGLPPAEGPAMRQPLPDVAAVVRVNDPERSRALWSLILSLASQAGPAGAPEPSSVQIAGASAESWSVQGVPVYLLTRGNELWISPSRGAIERSLAARQARKTVLDDPLYAKALGTAEESRTFLLAANAGRCARIAQSMVPPESAQCAAMVAQLCERTLVSLEVVQSDTRLALGFQIMGVPDVSGLVVQAMRGNRAPPRNEAVAQAAGDGGIASLALKARAAIARKPGEVDLLLERFETCQEQDRTAALECGKRILDAAADDATALNNFAWKLLTEPRYANRYDELALEVSERSNEVSGYRSWMFVDTLALARFRKGDVDEAIALEEKAVELAGTDPRRREAEAQLETFRKAARERAGEAEGDAQ
jgi:tetratricopeptide (TPR) repeat protein